MLRELAVGEMGKPRQVPCQVKGCDTGWTNLDGEFQEGVYYTDPECGNVSERSQDLRDHVAMAHEHQTKEIEAKAKQVEAEALKLKAEADKLRAEAEVSGASAVVAAPVKGERKANMVQPTVEENVTESDWSYFLAEWERYCGATGLDQDPPGAVRHLWQACSDGLRRALHNDGARVVQDVDVLLQRVKSLAVRRRNNLVNIMTLQGLGQEKDEGVHAFLARLNGQAELCDLCVTCPRPECQEEVSFIDRFKMLQLVRGLHDKEIQEKVLAAGAALEEGKEMSLTDVVKMVEAAELGKSTHAQISKAGGLYRMSDHQRKKMGDRVEKGRGRDGGGERKFCGFCGRNQHPRDECPARDKECNHCKMKGHFSIKCRKKQKDKDTDKKKVAEISTESTVNTLEVVEIDDDFAADVFRLSVAEEATGPGWAPPCPRGLSPPRSPAKGCVDSVGVQEAQVGALGEHGRVQHQQCDSLGRWRPGRVEGHGRVRIRLDVCEEAYRTEGAVPPKSHRSTTVSALAVTGAQH